MKKSKYRITTIKVGVKDRFIIQQRSLIFWWKAVVNQLVSPISRYEFKLREQAEKKLKELSAV